TCTALAVAAGMLVTTPAVAADKPSPGIEVPTPMFRRPHGPRPADPPRRRNAWAPLTSSP
ncbi:hypothetical protein, partial [Streptomyces violaceoruber]|uniref:hypothetical protein n=1 Tax=Streptomyces violaceoruber TaxID=1935 RepID=UPI00403D0507